MRSITRPAGTASSIGSSAYSAISTPTVAAVAPPASASRVTATRVPVRTTWLATPSAISASSVRRRPPRPKALTGLPSCWHSGIRPRGGPSGSMDHLRAAHSGIRPRAARRVTGSPSCGAVRYSPSRGPSRSTDHLRAAHSGISPSARPVGLNGSPSCCALRHSPSGRPVGAHAHASAATAGTAWRRVRASRASPHPRIGSDRIDSYYADRRRACPNFPSAGHSVPSGMRYSSRR